MARGRSTLDSSHRGAISYDAVVNFNQCELATRAGAGFRGVIEIAHICGHAAYRVVSHGFAVNGQFDNRLRHTHRFRRRWRHSAKRGKL